MVLDLSSLRDALAALNASLRYLDSDLAADPGLRDQFRAAAIQAFEFTYELSFKFMKRQLEQIVSVPAAVDEMTFMQVVRASAEAGLLDEVSRFFEYREARNITSHSYDKRKAERIVGRVAAVCRGRVRPARAAGGPEPCRRLTFPQPRSRPCFRP